MSATPRHAKRSLLARFAALFRYDPARPARPVYVGYAGHEIAAKTWLAADGRRQWGPAEEPATAPPASDAWDSPEAMAQVLAAFRALADAGTDSSSDERSAA